MAIPQPAADGNLLKLISIDFVNSFVCLSFRTDQLLFQAAEAIPYHSVIPKMQASNFSEVNTSTLRREALVNKAALKLFVDWHTPLHSTQTVHVSIKVCHSVLIKPTC